MARVKIIDDFCDLALALDGVIGTVEYSFASVPVDGVEPAEIVPGCLYAFVFFFFRNTFKIGIRQTKSTNIPITIGKFMFEDLPLSRTAS